MKGHILNEMRPFNKIEVKRKMSFEIIYEGF